MPTRREPSSVNATTEGVVRAPSEFSITRGDLPSITATQLLVVPKSIPITSPASVLLNLLAAMSVAPLRSEILLVVADNDDDDDANDDDSSDRLRPN